MAPALFTLNRLEASRRVVTSMLAKHSRRGLASALFGPLSSCSRNAYSQRVSLYLRATRYLVCTCVCHSAIRAPRSVASFAYCLLQGKTSTRSKVL